MKTLVSVRNGSLLGLLTIAFLAGCGSVSSNTAPAPTPTSSPTPTPVVTPSPTPSATPTPSPTPTAAHGTFIFVSDTQATTGYRLNPDGTLSLLSGSPFPISGLLAASGKFLMVGSGNTLASYRVDPGTGVPRKVASTSVGVPTGLAADAKDVYVASVSFNNNLLTGFHVSPSGALGLVPGDNFFGEVCGGCPAPNSVALNNSFVAVGATEDPGNGDFGQFVIFSRASDGSVTFAGDNDGPEEDSVAIQHPNGNVGFAIDSNLGSINSYLINANGGVTAGTSLSPGAAPFVDELVDATGKFLLSVDGSGVVHVFSIDSATAAFTQIGTSEAAGNGANRIIMDSTGRFVIVAQSSSAGTPPGTDQITVFTFDPASGAMQKLQSYPVGKAPSHMTIVVE
jgi:Lactonase, 7-bladed beta-propeller